MVYNHLITEEEKEIMSYRSKTTDVILCGIFAALIAICSWISIPAVVPFTLQTFAVFLTVGLLGTKRGLITVLVYLLLGAIGAPVFAGFGSGMGIILGPTGGYLIGFLATALITGIIISRFGSKVHILAIAMVAGLIACYAFGTAWFMYVYGQQSGPVGLGAALSGCLIPFIIPDGA